MVFFIIQEREDEMSLRYTEMNDLGFGITMNIKQSLFKDKSEFQDVEILETEGLGRMLLLDDLVMTTEEDEFFYHEMIAHIPMMNHKCPKTVLVIGGGDGGTVREVLKHESVEEVVLCEIDGMVVDACKEYLPTIACGLSNPKVKIVIDDGYLISIGNNIAINWSPKNKKEVNPWWHP